MWDTKRGTLNSTRWVHYVLMCHRIPVHECGSREYHTVPCAWVWEQWTAARFHSCRVYLLVWQTQIIILPFKAFTTSLRRCLHKKCKTSVVNIFDSRCSNVTGKLHVIVKGTHDDQEIRVQIQFLIAPSGMKVLKFFIISVSFSSKQ